MSAAAPAAPRSLHRFANPGRFLRASGRVLPYLAAAGAAPDPAWKVDGTDLLPVWTGKSSAPERTLFWEWRSEGSDQLAALRGDFKLVTVNGGRPELFDVEADPAERRNVIAEHPETAKRLQSELKAWIATERKD